MHLILLAILAITVLAIIVFSVKERKEAAIRQNAFGCIKAYELLKDQSGYAALKTHFASCEKPDQRYFYSVSMSRLFPLKYLQAWVKDDPDSADAQLCYGARLLQWAWSSRGYGRGRAVNREAWRVCFQRLDMAVDALRKSAELNPSDPTPWAYLIMAATWRSDEDEVKQFCFDQAISRDPYNWPAHMHMLVALSAKWGGDNQKMIAFAEQVAASAPVGSDLNMLPVKAYIEHYKHLDLCEHQRAQASQYIHRYELLQRVEQAYRRSIGATNYRASMWSIFVRYNVTGWFWITRNQKLLQHELELLGDRIEDAHWRWVCNEGELDLAREFVSGEHAELLPDRPF